MPLLFRDLLLMKPLARWCRCCCCCVGVDVSSGNCKVGTPPVPLMSFIAISYFGGCSCDFSASSFDDNEPLSLESSSSTDPADEFDRSCLDDATVAAVVASRFLVIWLSLDKRGLVVVDEVFLESRVLRKNDERDSSTPIRSSL